MKYELTNETINFFGKKLFRIRALKNIGNNVKKGDLGGFVESENNLSQKGDCWIFNLAKAYDNAMIYGEAEIYDSAEIFGSAMVHDLAKVYDHAMIFGEAEIYGEAKIYNSMVCNSAKVYGKAIICNLAMVYGNAQIFDLAKVSGKAMVYGEAMVFGKARVSDEAKVCGSAIVYDSAEVCGEAKIEKATDVFTITPIGSRNGTTTFYKAKDGKIFVKCGCKNTDIDTWLNMVQKTHGDNKHAKAYRLAAQIARLQILGEEV